MTVPSDSMRSLIDRLPWLTVALSAFASIGVVFHSARQSPEWSAEFGAGLFYGFCPYVLFIAPLAYALGLLIQRLIRGKSEPRSRQRKRRLTDR